MTAYNITYKNKNTNRFTVIVMLGYTPKTVALEFNTFGGNLTIVAIQPK